jgi:hypothetical protein
MVFSSAFIRVHTRPILRTAQSAFQHGLIRPMSSGNSVGPNDTLIRNFSFTLSAANLQITVTQCGVSVKQSRSS